MSAATTLRHVGVAVHGVRLVDLDAPLPRLEPECAGPGGIVRVLVRVHGRAVAVVPVTVGPDGVDPDGLADLLWADAPSAATHLLGEGLEPHGPLTGAGLPPASPAPCEARRRELLAAAPLMTVLIATHDRPSSLARCLRSVLSLEHPHFEIVVVDSAPSGENTAELLADLVRLHGEDRLRYVREPRPGLALAHNRGLDVARGAWVAITDDDVVVDDQWLAGIVEGVAMADDVGCVTGPIMPAEIVTPAQDLVEQWGGFTRGFESRLVNTGRHRPADPLFPLAVGRFGSGANMAFDAELLRARGGFDAAMGAGTPARGGDDLLGLLRVLTARRSLVYQPASVVWHFHRRDDAALRQMATGYGTGLGAYLTSAAVHEPALVAGMLRSAVPGLRHMLSRSSAKNAAKAGNYPRGLERAEQMAVLRGPLAYAVSRWRHRDVLAGPETRPVCADRAAAEGKLR